MNNRTNYKLIHTTVHLITRLRKARRLSQCDHTRLWSALPSTLSHEETRQSESIQRDGMDGRTTNPVCQKIKKSAGIIVTWMTCCDTCGLVYLCLKASRVRGHITSFITTVRPTHLSAVELLPYTEFRFTVMDPDSAQCPYFSRVLRRKGTKETLLGLMVIV